MKQSLGLIETEGLAAGIEAADAAVKSASVELIGYELTKGGGWITIKIQGGVGAVKAAVDAAKMAAARVNRVVSTRVIPRPSAGLDMLVRNPDTIGSWPPEGPDMPEPPTPQEHTAATQTESSPSADMKASGKKAGSSIPADVDASETKTDVTALSDVDAPEEKAGLPSGTEPSLDITEAPVPEGLEEMSVDTLEGQTPDPDHPETEEGKLQKSGNPGRLRRQGRSDGQRPQKGVREADAAISMRLQNRTDRRKSLWEKLLA